MAEDRIEDDCRLDGDGPVDVAVEVLSAGGEELVSCMVDSVVKSG